jgi:putative ABC transport system permease protein
VAREPVRRRLARNARSFGVLEDLARDARHAVRRLARERSFSIPVVAALGIGIGVTAAMFALVNAVLIRPLPYREADRLVALRHTARAELPMTGLSTGTFLHYRTHNRVFDDVAVYVVHLETITDDGSPEQVRLVMTSPSLFSVLRARTHIGRFPTAEDYVFGERAGILLGYDFWRRRYGADSTILGRDVEIARRGNYAVVGVAEPGFYFPDHDTQVWMGWPQEGGNAGAGSDKVASLRGLGYSGVARLKPGVTPEAAERDLVRLVGTLPEAYPDVTMDQLWRLGVRGVAVPLKDVVIGDVRVALLMLFATGAFLLLITWANVTNLVLVRGERLRREVAVSRALGASFGHLARRVGSESLTLATLGGALGLLLAASAVRARFGFALNEIPRLRDVRVDGPVLTLALGLAVFSALLLTVVSLVSARRLDLAPALTGAVGRMTAGQSEQNGRRILVATQVALALTLLIGSALMAESFWRLKQVKLGFEPDGKLTFFLPIPPSVYGNYHLSARVHHEILGRIRALPGVHRAEAGNIAGFPLTPVPSYYQRQFTVADGAPQDSIAAPYALFSFATPGYFEAMGIPIIRGRSFRRVDTNREAHGVIISASLARALFANANPVGRRVRWARATELPAYTVVGVAGDVPSETIRQGPSEVLYFPNLYPPQADSITGVVHIYIPSDEMYVVSTSLPGTSVVPAIRRAIAEVDPKLLMTNVATMDEVVADSMARARLTMLLLLIAAGTALFLGVLGIYGILAYTVSQRTSELGVRMALGATPARIVGLVVRQGLLLALAGVAVGIPAAFALTRFLRSVLYEVSPSDPLAFAAMAALLLAVAVAASFVPARRAGRIDVVQAVKGD